MAGAAFMNTVRWHIAEIFRSKFPDAEIHTTNGAATKASRRTQRMAKTHANDAYCMGKFRPRHKAKEMHYKKRRRNDRVLSKFYDAKYIDARTGKKVSGRELGSNRTSRSVPRDNPNNLRKFHGMKLIKGHVSVRKKHYGIHAGDVVLCKGMKRLVHAIHRGNNVEFEADGISPKSASPNKVKIIRMIGGWHSSPE